MVMIGSGVKERHFEHILINHGEIRILELLC